VAKNLVELHIYLESNNIQYILEQHDYEFSQLMSDVGGVIGLYLGIAVVSAIELIESCFLYGFVRLASKSRRPANGQHWVRAIFDLFSFQIVFFCR
jgi:hypothetical protein